MNTKKLIYIAFLLSAIIIISSGCKSDSAGRITNGNEVGGIATKTSEEESETEYKRYNAEDKAVVLDINLTENKVSLQSLSDSSKYIVTYTGASIVLDKFGTNLTMAQLVPGMTVDVYLVKGTQKLIKIQETTSGWQNSQATNLIADEEEKIITIGSNKYKYDDSLVIVSNGKAINIEQVHHLDELKVYGVDNKITSIIVTKGHGYIKLLNETNMVGGIIEVGTKIITLITKDMIIVAPEGDYTLTASKNGTGGSKEISVKRDEEINVSVGEFQGEVTRVGTYNFTVEPEGAIMKIDGTTVDYSELVSLDYGTHSIVVSAEGYTTYKSTLVVESSYVNKTITLTDEDETTTAEETTTSTYKIKVTTPSDVEVYFDGVYKGTSPVSFTKSSGTHVIVLRKTGYTSKTYTVSVTDDNNDVTFNFDDLVASE